MIDERVDLAGHSVSRETLDRLQEFEGLVRRWTPAINLVSKNSVSQMWDRHIVDSAQLFWLLPPAVHWVDLGAGGGFPGAVIAILAKELAPAMQVTLVESDLRKATFLRQAVQTLELSVAVVSRRIEDIAPLAADRLSARALASLPDLLGLAERHLSTGGVAVFPKGARHDEEVAMALKDWVFDLDVRPSVSDPAAAILLIRNIQRAQNH